MSLYYAAGFARGFVRICETEFAIYLEKWETRYVLIASPLAPRSTRCAAAVRGCGAEIRGARGQARQRAGWRLQMCVRCRRKQATALPSASLFSN